MIEQQAAVGGVLIATVETCLANTLKDGLEDTAL